MKPVVAAELAIPIDGARLGASFAIPAGAETVVAFAHGSGSGRSSPRNTRVARYFHTQGLGTLLFDLLTTEEAREDEALRSYRFDIALLGERLVTASRWLRRQALFPGRLGFFGASTGAAAALVAAAEMPEHVGAIVSRGGRPDLAGRALARVEAPTLLIVGGLDADVLELNERAARELRCVREVAVVPGATHLFPEPGALDEVARLAADWFVRHCSRAGRPTGDASEAGTTVRTTHGETRN
jgi:dienelactone hydrolase